MNVGDLISLEELEREHIRQVIAKTKNLGEASRVLGIDAATLYRKRKRWRMAKDGRDMDGQDMAASEGEAEPEPEPVPPTM
jgi:hypothetical protein